MVQQGLLEPVKQARPKLRASGEVVPKRCRGNQWLHYSMALRGGGGEEGRLHGEVDFCRRIAQQCMQKGLNWEHRSRGGKVMRHPSAHDTADVFWLQRGAWGELAYS